MKADSWHTCHMPGECVDWRSSPGQCWHERLRNQEAALASEVQQDVLTAGEVSWQGSCPPLHQLRIHGVTKGLEITGGNQALPAPAAAGESRSRQGCLLLLLPASCSARPQHRHLSQDDRGTPETLNCLLWLLGLLASGTPSNTSNSRANMPPYGWPGEGAAQFYLQTMYRRVLSTP